ncbi:hypothetical protein [Rickettsia endosymbiont of Gonocerus acuteangulatus]|uniref:hypothetical protein n=1 Tax=Rickettsia endosymbiont of Gonocerus acuteangulatus TaxID=3066266 RepID=UPI0031331587
MAFKKRPLQISQQKIENLAKELADKPYGYAKEEDSLVRTTISLPSSVLFKLEELSRHNKRTKSSLKSVSAIIRDYIAKSLNI